MKTKPFDLDAAMNGAKLVTRDGREAKFIAYVPEADIAHRVVVLVGGEVFTTYEDGMYTGVDKSRTDIFLAVKTRSINGHEYPDPERVEPKKGTAIYVPRILSDVDVGCYFWGEWVQENEWLHRGLVHLTRENAEQHAQAIILAGGGEV